MEIFTAPEKIETELPTVFLAGGITNCPDWQQKIINFLSEEDIAVINPRRKDFPINDPSASQEQIEWEFHALNNCDVFSMWFTSGESDQPICMYELGRHLALRPYGSIAIGVQEGYKRKQDVYIQTKLINPYITITNDLYVHSRNIMKKVIGL